MILKNVKRLLLVAPLLGLLVLAAGFLYMKRAVKSFSSTYRRSNEKPENCSNK